MSATRIEAEQRLLIGGPGEQGGVLYSFDGRLIAYDNVVDGVDKVTVAEADGSNPRHDPRRAVHRRSRRVVAG